MAIEILKPGLATSIQDSGRPGYYHLGIPMSGAMDQESYLVANLLVGNDEKAAVIECTLLAPEMQLHQDALIAITGAPAEPKINGEAVPMNTSIAVRSGDKLSFGFMRTGVRSYVAVAGGIDVPLILGSRSTYALGAFGGFEGRKLQAGDVVPIGAPSPAAKAGRSIDPGLLPRFDREVTLRMMPGLYFHRLKPESAETFFSDTWTVAPEADRIAYRYKAGQPLKYIDRTPPFGAGSDPSNIVDSGYPYGSIQVPSGLEPIIVHRDAVSGGGYGVIGTVISADMNLIAQMQPNNKAHFLRVDMHQALQARRLHKQHLARIRQALSG
ncbi:biotin-dependent carboxyltransferase family protein [Bordetella sp. FB-8]|uniref:5-oxoprolinase subunit C family protein n=1 Tax=Bordetella sp. FB-8 TaxID=1159870 RepID=UPI00036FEC5C|nr:biotin-dependent carboxyltransferase family protein [Bordetella sp. FB-8]